MRYFYLHYGSLNISHIKKITKKDDKKKDFYCAMLATQAYIHICILNFEYGKFTVPYHTML